MKVERGENGAIALYLRHFRPFNATKKHGNIRVFFVALCLLCSFDAFCAGFHFFAIDFCCLQVNIIFSWRLIVCMADSLAIHFTFSANFTNSAHRYIISFSSDFRLLFTFRLVEINDKTKCLLASSATIITH